MKSHRSLVMRGTLAVLVVLPTVSLVSVTTSGAAPGPVNSGAPSAAGDAQLTGTITREYGVALPDVKVTRYALTGDVAVPDGEPVVTSSRGFYYMDVPPGTYRLCFHDLAGQYYDECWDNAATVDQATDIVLTESEAAQANASLTKLGRGSVVGHVSGPPGSAAADVAKMRVYLNGQNIYDDTYHSVDGGWADVDSEGNYQMESVPVGTYALYFSGWSPSEANTNFSLEYFEDAFHIADATLIDVRGGEQTHIPNAMVEHVPHVTGAVVDKTGRGLAGISVVDAVGIPQLFATTDESGSFDFKAREGTQQMCFEDYSGVYATSCWDSGTPVYQDATPFQVPHTGVLSGMGTVMTLARTVSVVNRPRIRGKAVVGTTLRLSSGSFEPSNVTKKYQWLANGRAVANATRAAFKLTRTQLRKKMSVRITVSATEYNRIRVVTASSAVVRRR